MKKEKGMCVWEGGVGCEMYILFFFPSDRLNCLHPYIFMSIHTDMYKVFRSYS